MLCTECKLFCANVGQRLTYSWAELDDTSKRDRWPNYRAATHRGLLDLELASRSLCPICRLIWHGLTRSERESSDVSSIELEIDPSDRELPMLYVYFTGSKQQTLSERRLLAMYSGEMQSRELASTLAECSKAENLTTGSKSSFKLASYWLNECLNNHPECIKASPGGFIPSRVVDVGPSDGSQLPRLRDTRTEPLQGNSNPYAALSHCWGRERIITTTRATLEDRMEQITMDSLSRTFQDAIQTCRELDVRYIWIDSLCIVQDDKDDWASESQQMCDIYRLAHLTISAAHASGGNVGCFVERDGLVYLPFTLQFSRMHGTKPKRTLFTPFPRNQPSIPVDKAEPPLYGRAWVLQEQMLSTRMLCYEVDQMRWECLSTHGSERSPLGGAARRPGYFKDIQNGIASTKADFLLPETLNMLYNHQSWCLTVMAFSHRGMTIISDRLVAIGGIVKAIQRATSATYVVGLWKEYLWRGLLWSIPYNNEYIPTTMFAHTVHDCSRHSDLVVPSWTWASVTSPIVYPIPGISSPSLTPICEILDVQVEEFSSGYSGQLTIRGDVRVMYIKHAYSPYIIQAHALDPEDRVTKQSTSSKLELREPIYISGSPLSSLPNNFDPEHSFTVSLRKPTKVSDFQPIPGSWRPDEVLRPEDPVTFIAIARYPRGSRAGYVADEDQMEVYTLGLQPVPNKSGSYRRVGYGVWQDCAWYGFDCSDGGKSEPTRVEKGFRKIKSWMGEDRGMLAPGLGQHKHNVKGDARNDGIVYEKHTTVSRQTLVIV